MSYTFNPFTGTFDYYNDNSHDLGYFATESALTTAHPTALDGDWAIIGSTDTVWVWDSDTSAWVDTVTKGQVSSVFTRTGAVVAADNDYTLSQINGTSAITLDYAFDNGKVIDGADSAANTVRIGNGTQYVGFGAYDVGLGAATSNFIGSEAYTILSIGAESAAEEPLFIVAGFDTAATRSPSLLVTS